MAEGLKSLSAGSFQRLPAAALLLPLLILASLAALVVPPEFYLLIAAALVLVAGGAVLLFFQRRAHLGFSVLIVSSVLLPLERGGSATRISVPLLLVVLLTALWLAGLLIRRQLPPFREKPVKILFLFLSGALLAFLAGQYPWFPTDAAPLAAQVGGLGIFFLSGAAFLLAAYTIPTVRQLKWLTWIFLASGALVVLTKAIPGLGLSTAGLVSPKSIGSMFWTWLAAMSFGQALVNRRLFPVARLALLMLVVLILYAGVGLDRDWVSGWLPALVAIGVIAFLRFPRLSIVLLLLTIPAFLTLQGMIEESLRETEQYSADTRVAAWLVMFEIVKKNPLLGLGPANYYFYTPLFPILGWYVSFNSHNNYIDILAQTGILGLSLFLWFAFEMVRLAWRMRGTAPSGFSRAYVHAVLGGLAGTLVAGMLGDWVLPFTYNVGLSGFRSSVLPWIFMGGLIALARLARKAGARPIQDEETANLSASSPQTAAASWEV